jgi:3-hydroxyacyl-CoA dehydrogenase
MPWDVDRVLYEFGMPMGPFAMSDLAGLDLGRPEDASEAGSVEDILCAQNRRGQKTGAGFYDYDENRVARPSTAVEKIILGVSARDGIARRPIGDQEILERCLYPLINEGAKILQEGIVARSSDIDTIWINGYGWPAYRGGPMYYGDGIGLEKVLRRMREFEREHGPEFKPAALLEQLVVEGRSFREL